MLYNETLETEYYNITEAEAIFEKIKKDNGQHYDGNRRNKWLDISAAFDIEATNFETERNGRYFKQALMYIWQFGIHDDKNKKDYIFIGRTWSEFKKLLDIIGENFKKKTRKGVKCKYWFPIYVHNLSYEYTFLRPIIKEIISETFAVKKQTPLYTRLSNGIEFRCSYLLSGCALKYLPTTKTHKLDGDLDYDKVRHSLTPLTDKEMAYCIADVLVLLEYITDKRRNEGSIGEIPYTKTGYPRRGIKEHCIGKFGGDKRARYIEDVVDLGFRDTLNYYVAKGCFMGGHTAANPLYMGEICKYVICYDIASSYPTVICSFNRFPKKLLGYYDKLNEEQYKALISEGFAIIARVNIKNLRTKRGKEYDSWISLDKVFTETEIERHKEAKTLGYNNGKIAYFNGTLQVYLTEVDFQILERFYNWDSVNIENAYIYSTDYLPRSVIEYVLKLYNSKTKLKGSKLIADLIEYGLSKEMVNSIYGMMVQDLVKADLIIDDVGVWHSYSVNEDDRAEFDTTDDPETIAQLTARFYKDKVENYNKKLGQGQITTPYIWGVYVSAFARERLSKCIEAFGDLGLFVYSDTDSVYVLEGDKHKYIIDGFNKEIAEKFEAMCEHYNFPKDIWRPKTIKGEEKPLGFWEEDSRNKMFKTLGAKRYIKLDEDDCLHITVAGLGKDDGARELASYDSEMELLEIKDKKTGELDHYEYKLHNPEIVFSTFENDLVIENTGKLTHTILTEKDYCKGTLVDYLGNSYDYEMTGGTHLSGAKFSMSISDLYLDYITGLETTIGGY